MNSHIISTSIKHYKDIILLLLFIIFSCSCNKSTSEHNSSLKTKNIEQENSDTSRTRSEYGDTNQNLDIKNPDEIFGANNIQNKITTKKIKSKKGDHINIDGFFPESKNATEIVDYFPNDVLLIDKNKINIKKNGIGFVIMKNNNETQILIIEIKNPLIGTWKRTTNPFRGMEINFYQDEYENLNAKVIKIPEIEEEDKIFYDKIREKKNYNLKCVDKWFPLGSIKIKIIERIGENSWIISNFASTTNCADLPKFDQKNSELFMDGDLFYLRDRKQPANLGGDQTWQKVSE